MLPPFGPLTVSSRATSKAEPLEPPASSFSSVTSSSSFVACAHQAPEPAIAEHFSGISVAPGSRFRLLTC